MKGPLGFVAGAGLALLLVLILFLGVRAALKVARTPGGRYRMATDPASRHSFQYVQDKTTGRWVNREIELRVSVRRPAPESWSDDAHGDRLSLQLLRPISAQTAGLRSGLPVVEGEWLVWRGWEVLDESDLRGQSTYAVTVQWPVEGQSTRFDDSENFRLPPLGAMPPDAWSEWAEAADQRPGAFGWWAEVQGAPRDSSAARPAFPFQFRYRLVLFDNPGVTP